MTPQVILGFLMASLCLAQRPTIPIYVGNRNGTYSTKVNMRYNIAMQQTVLSSNDFNCTTDANCTYVNNATSLNLGNSTISVAQISVPMGLLNTPFNESMQVYYLMNDTQRMGSVVGLAKDSTFLQYLYKQDSNAGYQLAFNLDSMGDLDFHQFTGSNYTALGPGPYNVYITTQYGSDWNVTQGTLCFANTIDDNAANNSLIGVANANYTNWYNFLSRYYQKSANDNYFYVVLTDQNGNFVTQLDFLMQDLLAANSSGVPSNYIRNVSDAYAKFRGCDLFTGNLLLKKFDFHLAYNEDANGFTYQYMLNSPGYLINPPPKDTGVSGWVILLVLILLGVAGYFVYQWYITRNQGNLPQNDGYVSMNIQPVEMNEVPRANAPR